MSWIDAGLYGVLEILYFFTTIYLRDDSLRYFIPKPTYYPDQDPAEIYGNPEEKEDKESDAEEDLKELALKSLDQWF